MGRSWYRIVVVNAWALVSALLVGCGATEVDNAPDLATIEFQPESVELVPLGTEDCSLFFNTTPTFRVVLRNGDGQPLNDVPVTFSLQTPLLAFIAPDGSLVPSQQITVRTDENGVIEQVPLAVAFCQFKSQLHAFSGTAFGSADIAVKAGTATTNQPPVASFFATPDPGAVGSPVTFDGSASSDPDGTVVSYLWDFGDGTPAVTTATPTTTHTYAVANTYTVTLTVTDDQGATASTGITLQVI